MPRGAKERDIDYAALHARYIAGENGMEIAASAGIKWAGLYAAWRRLGMPRRSATDAARLLVEAHPERADLIRYARAKQPKQFSAETLVRRALSREERQLGISPGERTLADALRGFGYDVRHQVAIGPYNADLVILPQRLVIEVSGGGHSVRSRANAATRTAYIEAQGYRLVHVWAKSRTPDWLTRALRKVHTSL